MHNPLDHFWQLRLETCRQALEANRFEAFVVESPDAARRLFYDTIRPQLEVRSAAWGDSMTLLATGILDDLRRDAGVSFIDTFDPSVPRETLMERRREALLADLFLTGTNAVTEAGQLVNLDMIGNRTGGITFGPRHVVIVVGRNKIVPDLVRAMERVKNYAAPLNAIRHEGWQTPCRETGRCIDCNSRHRICNTWTITEKSYPAGRIKVILVNADLGL
ncbi:MAG TPA: lactate utilization protein [Desulfobacteraceae bacterium]|nr:lactate utilization protein [Desulfobacteraceae bacterium]